MKELWWKSDQRGEVNPFLIATIIFALLAVGLGIGFGWAYVQMTDYRDKSDAKVNVAAEEARKVQKAADDKQFAEDYKKPNQTFQGPSDSGSVSFNYPKTWAVYIEKDGGNGGEFSAYFNPKSVPAINKQTAYALRVEVVGQAYDSVLRDYEGKIKDGSLGAAPIVLGKTNDFTGYKGMRIDGQFEKTINGSVVIFKIRDKTLKLSVDNQNFMKDYNDTVLPSLKFEL